MTSKRQLLLDAFQAVGYPPVQLRTRKYLGFRNPEIDRVYLVGKSAGLRVKRSDEGVDRSVSLTGNSFYRALLTIGSHAGCYTTQAQARTDLEHEYQPTLTKAN